MVEVEVVSKGRSEGIKVGFCWEEESDQVGKVVLKATGPPGVNNIKERLLVASKR